MAPAIIRRSGAVLGGTLGSALLATTGALTITGFFGRLHWLFNLSSYFRLQYIWIQALGLFGALFAGHYRRARWWGAFLGVNLTQLAPFINVSVRKHERLKALEATVQARIKILQLNVLATNHNYQAVADLIRTVKPDILALEEFTSHWHDALKKTRVLQEFFYENYVVPAPGEEKSGRALFSKYEICKDHLHTLEQTKAKAIMTKIIIAGEPVTVILMHPEASLGTMDFLRQMDDWDDISDWRHLYEDRLIVVGDLNVTPWTFPYPRFARKMQVRSTQSDMGLQPSFPTYTPFPMIPIDHCLISKHFIVLDRQTGPHVGSDHLPVMIELGMLPPEAVPA